MKFGGFHFMYHVYIMLRIGEIPGPDTAAVLAAALRLGHLDGSTRTYPCRVRVDRARQH